MYLAFRVLQPFRWRGWHYGPQHVNRSIDPMTGGPEFCGCREYAGDVFIVEAGHPRLDMKILIRDIVSDAALPSGDELVKEGKFQRLLRPPELVTAGKRR